MANRIRRFLRLAASTAVALCLFAGAAQAYELHDGPTGVLKYNKERSYNGYTLFTPTEDNTVIYLIDMTGEIVHTWKITNGEGSTSVSRLLPNGNLLVFIPFESAPENIGGYSGLFENFDLESKFYWSFSISTANEVKLRTFVRMTSANTQLLG